MPSRAVGMDGLRRWSRKTLGRGCLASIAGIVCAVMLAGCQLLTVAEVKAPQTPVKVEPTDLERLLAAGYWEVDPTWSMLEITARFDARAAPSEPWRWKFVVPEPPKNPLPGAAPAPALPVDIAELRQRYAWLWEPPLTEQERDRELWTQRTDELKTVAQAESSSGMTAAILLARCGLDQPEQWDQLFEKVPPKVDPAIKPETYAAAAETLCCVSATPVGEPEENFAPAGRWLEDLQIAEPVRAELIRGIARRIAPRQIPGVVEIVTQKDAALLATPVYRAAVEACVIHAWNQHPGDAAKMFEQSRWPDGLWSCRFAKDTTLRKLFGRWAVLAGHPETLAVLKGQRFDIDLGVREEAVISLGFLTGDEVREELRAVMTGGTDPEKDAAIGVLARGGVEEILPYAQHDSPRLRATTARTLGQFSDRTAAVALANLLGDRSAKVQLAAVEACAQPAWKDAGRASLLLHALRVSTLETQIIALEALRGEWGHDPDFPLNGTAAERDASVRKLAAEHQVSSEVFASLSPLEKIDQTGGPESNTQDQVRQLLQVYLDPSMANPREAVREELLAALDESAVPLIERELSGMAGAKAEAIYREILPKMHPVYAALVMLESKDAVKRRRAARAIRDAAASASLTPELLRRLNQFMVTEQDRQVWQDVSTALLPDALPDAAQIALIALNSPWPDIRHFGCEYFERHPQPEYAEWVLPRLDDSDRQMRLRAVRILAKCGNPTVLDGSHNQSDTPGLRKLLTETDLPLRWEAVLAMTALGDQQAAQEIIRQSYDPHPRQRETAVTAMGQSGQSRFMEHLLRRAWTENDVSVQFAMLQALDQLAPMNDRPGLAPDSSISDKIIEWARWWDERQKKTPAPSNFNRPQ